MVSNARLDLPEPDRPVTTTRRSRGISSEMFLRLWTRAPWTATVVRAAGRRCSRKAAKARRGAAFLCALAALREAFLELIRSVPGGKEGEFLHVDVALRRELDRRGRLADEPLVRQVLARRGHAAHVEVALEVGLDLGTRPGLADLAQVVDHRPEQRRRPLG